MATEHKIKQKAVILLSEEIKNGNGEELVPAVEINDDITEYITDSSFEALKKRFGVAEEDQSIRDEDFNPLTNGRASKKSDGDNSPAPSFKKDIGEAEVNSSLQNEFGTADSRFDSDAISFDEINIDLDSLDTLIDEDETAEIDRSGAYNTNTRVIYEDSEADDGIKRNTDIEVSCVFNPD